MLIFPLIHTERLKLRKLQIEDVPSLVKYANNKKISNNIVNIPYPYEEPNAVFRLSYVVQGFKARTGFPVERIRRKLGSSVFGLFSKQLNSYKKTLYLAPNLYKIQSFKQ